MTQDVRHQFVVFGGEERTPTLSFSRPHATTFFRQFINASSFP
jgi:hypothetical protein